MNRLLRLSFHDIVNSLRDPIRLYILAFPFIITGAVRWLLPYFESAMMQYVDLSEFHDLIAGMLLILIPVLIGALSGFIFLDEKDEGTSLVIITTPLGRGGYMLYRLLSPTLFAFILSLIILPLVHVIEYKPDSLFLLSIMAALEAPICALFISLLAGNKVEGIAAAKGLMLFLFIPIAGYFIKPGIKLLLGIVPFFWPVHAFLAAEESSATFNYYLMAGFIVHLIWLSSLVKLFKKKLTSS